MIRSLSTAVSGLKSNQVRMDVIGNNIANVNTTAFKRGRAAFQEVMGQQMLGVGRSAGGSGINPTVVGLGSAVGSIDQSWAQGALQSTNIPTDLALKGDGFFVINNNGQQLLTRAGNFFFDQTGQLVTSSGHAVQGWDMESNNLTDVRINFEAMMPPQATTEVQVSGNLSLDAEDGAQVPLSITVYNESGQASTLTLIYEKNGDTWETQSELPAGVSVNEEGLTFFGGSTTASITEQDGYAAGNLLGYQINPEGIVQLNFSNGQQQDVFQLAIGNVNNPNGLEQVGESFYSLTDVSGDLQLGRAGRDVRSAVVAGALEMSNVDLATEFTDMIVTQRGYQAAARVITTSDELLQETVQLKR